MPQIYLNYFSDNRANITYEPSTDKDLAKCKPIFVTEKEFQEIKEASLDKIQKILDNHKF